MQRFGSKRGLLLASAARSPQLVLLAAAAAEARNTSPLAALRDFALSSVAHLDHREELGNKGVPDDARDLSGSHGLGLVQLDVSDPEFRAHALAHSVAIVDSCARLLAAAQQAGELKPDADVPALARLTHVCFNGALQVWAVNGCGSLADFLRDQLDLLLSPYLSPARSSCGWCRGCGGGGVRRGCSAGWAGYGRSGR